MSAWVLILVTYGSNYHHIVTMQEFGSLSACRAAGQKIASVLADGGVYHYNKDDLIWWDCLVTT